MATIKDTTFNVEEVELEYITSDDVIIQRTRRNRNDVLRVQVAQTKLELKRKELKVELELVENNLRRLNAVMSNLRKDDENLRDEWDQKRFEFRGLRNLRNIIPADSLETSEKVEHAQALKSNQDKIRNVEIIKKPIADQERKCRPINKTGSPKRKISPQPGCSKTQLIKRICMQPGPPRVEKHVPNNSSVLNPVCVPNTKFRKGPIEPTRKSIELLDHWELTADEEFQPQPQLYSNLTPSRVLIDTID